MYTPDVQYGKEVGKALQQFQRNLLSDQTSVFTLLADTDGCILRKASFDYANLLEMISNRSQQRPRYELFFANRYLFKDRQVEGPHDSNKLRVSADAFRLLMSYCDVSPAFIYTLSRHYLPTRHSFRIIHESEDLCSYDQWYFLPVRVQVECTGKERSHATSTAGISQMNPFHYLHLPDEELDIRSSQIAVFLRHDDELRITSMIAVNFIDGRWADIVEEPQRRTEEVLAYADMLELEKHSAFIHLVFLSTVSRWWTNALNSVNEQLIAYENSLQQEIEADPSLSTPFYAKINRALHVMAAHLHRYSSELDSLEATIIDVIEHHLLVHGETGKAT